MHLYRLNSISLAGEKFLLSVLVSVTDVLVSIAHSWHVHLSIEPVTAATATCTEIAASDKTQEPSTNCQTQCQIFFESSKNFTTKIIKASKL
jgi:hypothetical protein